MFSSCLHRVPHRRSSSNQHKARSPLHKIDRDAAAARQVPGRRCATRYHTISLPSPASSYERYYFSSETGRRRARPNALTRPRGSQRPVRTASPGSSPRRSPLLFLLRRAGAGRWGLLVFAPSSCFFFVFCAAWVLLAVMRPFLNLFLVVASRSAAETTNARARQDSMDQRAR